jgi:hypothetical protein
MREFPRTGGGSPAACTKDEAMRLLRDYIERRRLRRMLFMLAASTRR